MRYACDGEDVTSTGKQGKVQTGTPKFTEVRVPLKVVQTNQPNSW